MMSEQGLTNVQQDALTAFNEAVISRQNGEGLGVWIKGEKSPVVLDRDGFLNLITSPETRSITIVKGNGEEEIKTHYRFN